MSGEREIRETADALNKADLRHTEVLPLFARLSNSEQNRIFQPHTGAVSYWPPTWRKLR